MMEHTSDLLQAAAETQHGLVIYPPGDTTDWFFTSYADFRARTIENATKIRRMDDFSTEIRSCTLRLPF